MFFLHRTTTLFTLFCFVIMVANAAPPLRIREVNCAEDADFETGAYVQLNIHIATTNAHCYLRWSSFYRAQMLGRGPLDELVVTCVVLRGNE